ncbi:DNA repair exonuclease [uncultured Thermosynechococcus sp.]|uniref:metallophosphoesterase family protein n=1 Tax=uncultured Thermosynechococcus sp. TaxID=436945 RepID=UPI002634322E|nr:DNA repair exonuclease [uncultured Thermosynechococcus sp.]
MVRFLHVADVHLGFSKYRQENPSRTLDFFTAFDSALQTYAIEAGVDFVLIAGDLFEERMITPGILNQAEYVLDKVRSAGIPVLAIEGNHDNCPYGVKSNWLRYLCEKDYLSLLEPDENGLLHPWDVETARGGYIDLPCGVRVIGSQWYGASAPRAIQQLASQIQALPPGPRATIMLFHHGLEGQVSRYQGALRYEELLPLRQAGVDYLALGHIHRHYAVEDWIFNPGAVEANSIQENQQQNPRGVLLVTLDNGPPQAELKQDYWQRPIYRYSLNLSPSDTVTQVERRLQDLVRRHREEMAEAIVEVTLRGEVGFERSELAVRSLQGQLQEASHAFIFRLGFAATPVAYQTYRNATAEPPPRALIEEQVFADLLASVAEYRDRAEPLAKVLMHLKEDLLQPNVNIPDLYQWLADFSSANGTRGVDCPMDQLASGRL